MRQPTEILHERDSMRTIKELTSAFEGIASMRIAQIKTQVESSEKFFRFAHVGVCCVLPPRRV